MPLNIVHHVRYPGVNNFVLYLTAHKAHYVRYPGVYNFHLNTLVYFSFLKIL